MPKLKVSKCLLTLFCFNVFLYQPVSAKSQTDGAAANFKLMVVHVEALKEMNQSDKATDYIKKELEKDKSNTLIWKYLAQTYFDQSQFQKSSDAFGEAIKYAEAEEVGTLNYQRANAEVKAGQVDSAKKYLKLAANDPVIKGSAEKAMMLIQSGVELPQIVPEYPGNWSGAASLSAGYDDNVLQFSESTLATASRTDTASAVVNPTASINYAKQTIPGLFNAALNLNALSYQNENAKAYDNFTAQLMAQLTGHNKGWAGLNHSISNVFKTTYSDRDTFTQQSWDDSIMWRGKKSLSGQQTLTFGQSVRYQKYFLAAGAASNDDRSGVALKPELTWANRVGDYSYSAGLSFEKLFAEGENFISENTTVPLNLQKSFTDKLSGSAGLTYSYVQYPSSSNNRKDGTVALNLGLQRAFSKTISASLDYGYSKNSSNIKTATYDRQNIGLKVTSEIQ